MQALQLDTPGQISMKLDGMTRQAKRKHPEEFEWAASLFRNLLYSGPDYPDSLLFTDIPRNVIGPAIRSLVKSGQIQQTGLYKRSQRPESNGRVVFQYRLKP